MPGNARTLLPPLPAEQGTALASTCGTFTQPHTPAPSTACTRAQPPMQTCTSAKHSKANSWVTHVGEVHLEVLVAHEVDDLKQVQAGWGARVGLGFACASASSAAGRQVRPG